MDISLFQYLIAYFFLYSCMLNSDVNTCLWTTVFFEAGHSMRGPPWSISAGDVDTVEQMPGVRERYCSQSQINLHKFVTPCSSSSFQTRLRGVSPRALLRRAPPCVGTRGGKEQGRSLVPCAVGVLLLPREGDSSLAVEVLVQLVNLYAA